MASQTTLQKKLAELQEPKQTHQNSRPKIQKVAEYLRNREHFEKQYSPKFVSIGPIHHDSPNLKLGENYKLTWAAKYIQTTQQDPEFLHKKIADNIFELKSRFADDVLALANIAESLKDFRGLEEKLAWLLFADGCSLLYILINVKLYQLDKPKDRITNLGQIDGVNINVDDDPEHLNMKVDQLVLVMMDVLLLENQLPYKVLKLLWKNENDKELIDTMKNFLKNYHWATQDKKTTWSRPGIFSNTGQIKKTKAEDDLPNDIIETPTHLLDLQRKMILLTKSNSKTEANKEANYEMKQSGKYSEEMMTYRNIQDLTAVGIKLKSSRTRSPTDVDFSEDWFAAKLTLPEIVVDDNTAASFLNLIAYEMCPDFKNDYGICSFAVFMDSLIDHPEDVKKLRSKGILVNSLGSDEEVANLFNIISTDLVLNPETYLKVKAKIHEHYRNKCNIWITEGCNTYFSNPWAITGFIAAVIALVLTFVQTWFSIFPSHN
ncbi:unnamed protein product [Lathyrus sativus]|nr:unnamed protein product [Lathyrus sativus]